jgi:hypothetical protein
MSTSVDSFISPGYENPHGAQAAFVRPDRSGDRHLADTQRPVTTESQRVPPVAGLTRFLERYVLNPRMRLGLALGLAPRAFSLLETSGRPWAGGRLAYAPTRARVTKKRSVRVGRYRRGEGHPLRAPRALTPGLLPASRVLAYARAHAHARDQKGMNPPPLSRISLVRVAPPWTPPPQNDSIADSWGAVPGAICLRAHTRACVTKKRSSAAPAARSRRCDGRGGSSALCC